VFVQALFQILRVANIDLADTLGAKDVHEIQGPPGVAPEVGFEPTTNRLTADRSTTELLRNFPVGGEPSVPPD
jgi:hypothetical protein